MARQTTNQFRRIWYKSPLMALAYIRRRITRKAKQVIQVDEWNIDWLGEEMRPFNSLRSEKGLN